VSELEWTAILRWGSAVPLQQVWSHDGGRTWDEPTVLESGSVDPDVVVMSNGVMSGPVHGAGVSDSAGSYEGSRRGVLMRVAFPI
jgi:hypothetical protein